MVEDRADLPEDQRHVQELEMRIAALEDKLRGLQLSEEDLKGYQRVMEARGMTDMPDPVYGALCLCRFCVRCGTGGRCGKCSCQAPCNQCIAARPGDDYFFGGW